MDLSKENASAGGSAFSRPSVFGDENHGPHEDGEPGMSLRDYFAAKAMQGFAGAGGAQTLALLGTSGDKAAADVAKAAYRLADAMLRAR